jgi:hypothetical protein
MLNLQRSHELTPVIANDACGGIVNYERNTIRVERLRCIRTLLTNIHGQSQSNVRGGHSRRGGGISTLLTVKEVETVFYHGCIEQDNAYYGQEAHEGIVGGTNHLLSKERIGHCDP